MPEKSLRAVRFHLALFSEKISRKYVVFLIEKQAIICHYEFRAVCQPNPAYNEESAGGKTLIPA
jgi:hypothetical protein